MKLSPSIAIALLASAAWVVPARAQDAPDTSIRDTSSTPEQRAAELVAKMTIEEKAAQLGHTAPAIPRLSVPKYNWWNEGLHGVARAGIATVFPKRSAWPPRGTRR